MLTEYIPIPTGSTKQSLYLVMQASASPNQPTAGFTFDEAGIILSYCKKRAARVAITPVTLAAITTAWTVGGVKLVDDTNMIGLVRFDVPDAMFAPDGISDEVFFSVQATGFEPTVVRIPLIDPIKKQITLTGTRTKTDN